MGWERPGQVRMYGSGVASSDFWGSIPSRPMQQLIIGEQIEKIAKLEAQAREAAEMLKEQSKILVEIHGTLLQRDNLSPCSKAPSLGSNEEVIPSSNQSPLKVNATVFILNIKDPTKVIVTTWIRSMDPTPVTGSHPLGEDWCEIDLIQPHCREEKLI